MTTRHRRESGAALALLGPASLLMLLTLVTPLALLGRDSLNRFDPTELMIEAVTAANYLRFFADPFYWDVLVTTIRVSIIVTTLCLLLGLPMAWRLARTASRWKSALIVLMVLPLFIGSTTRTAGWMILFARGGMLDTLTGLQLMYAEPAVIAGIVAINLPFTVLTRAARHRDRRGTLLHPVHERVRHAAAARRAALSHDGAAAVLGVQQRQQLAVRRRDRLHPDGHNAAPDRSGQPHDPAAVPGVTHPPLIVSTVPVV
jgi:hypothetical protein